MFVQSEGIRCGAKVQKVAPLPADEGASRHKELAWRVPACLCSQRKALSSWHSQKAVGVVLGLLPTLQSWGGGFETTMAAALGRGQFNGMPPSCLELIQAAPSPCRGQGFGKEERSGVSVGLWPLLHSALPLGAACLWGGPEG